MSQGIDRIIARHLGGSATPEEQDALQAWLAESERNRAIFAALTSDVKPDTEQAWGKFERHMRQSAPARPLRIAAWRLALRYAAAVALLVGVAATAWVRLGGNGNASPQAQVLAVSENEACAYALHDSASVLLNRGSKLSCLDDHSGGRRELKLEGEAFFELTASGGGVLVVHAEETLIRDVGTAFNVQAYPGDSSVTVFVQRGEVRFYAEDEAGSGLTLTAGETGIFDRRTKTFGRSQTDVNAAAYATRVLVFRDKPLGEALALIGRVYGATICVDDLAAAKTISVTFDNENLEEVVAVICETMRLQATQSNGAYVLTPQAIRRE
jgi:ferric-dicitrate binding protein FerR (iron transport regulator)